MKKLRGAYASVGTVALPIANKSLSPSGSTSYFNGSENVLSMTKNHNIGLVTQMHTTNNALYKHL
jgi:hypothetical protein